MPRRTHLIEILRDPADPTQFLYRHSDDVVGFRADLKKSDAFKINSGESVQWTSSLGNFAIIFESTTPFHGNAVAFGAAKGASHQNALVARSERLPVSVRSGQISLTPLPPLKTPPPASCR